MNANKANNFISKIYYIMMGSHHFYYKQQFYYLIVLYTKLIFVIFSLPSFTCNTTFIDICNKLIWSSLLQQIQMSTDLSPQIRAQLAKLAEKEAFAESIDHFVKNAVDILCGDECQQHEDQCPTALLLAFSHCYSNNISPSTLAAELPQSIRPTFLAACEEHTKKLPPHFLEEGIQQLKDVQWAINISLGRQLWNITIKFQSGRQAKLILNYQQLSVLVFKLGQVVAYAQNYQIS